MTHSRTMTVDEVIAKALGGVYHRTPEADAYWLWWLAMEGFIERGQPWKSGTVTVTEDGARAMYARNLLQQGRGGTAWPRQ